MKFTIREIKTGVATIDFEDGAWAEVPMEATETEEEFINKNICSPRMVQRGGFYRWSHDRKNNLRASRVNGNRRRSTTRIGVNPSLAVGKTRSLWYAPFSDRVHH